MRQEPGRTNQCLRGYTAGVQAIATQFVLFDQGDLGLDRSSDVGRDQAGAAAADDDDVALEARRLVPLGEYLVHAHDLHQPACNQREEAKQDK